MKTFALILMVAALLSMAGCAADPVSMTSTTNPKVPVSLLFENEGCKVYRFEDAGHFHYYANCKGSTVTILTESQSEGKTTRPNQMVTHYEN